MPLVKPTPPAAVTSVPTPVPSRLDRLNFRMRADAMMGWFPGGVAGINTVLTYLAAAVDWVEEQLGGLAAAVSSAIAARDQAVAASGAVLWVSGTGYVVGDVRRSPADLDNIYVRLTAGAGTTDPSLDAINWRKLPRSGLTLVTVAGTTHTAVAGQLVLLTNAAATTVTAPAAPAANDTFAVVIGNGRQDNLINWAGLKHEALTDTTCRLSPPRYSEWVYVNATQGWKIK